MFDNFLNFNNPFGIGIACVSAVIMLFTMLRQIHIIQLNSYNLDQQVLWYKKNILQFIVNIILFVYIIVFALSFIMGISRSAVSSMASGLFIVLLVGLMFYFAPIVLLVLLFENFPRKQKKKLVFTNRIQRLIVICVFLFALFYIPYAFNIILGYVSVLTGVALSPLVVFVAYLISLPLENAIRREHMSIAHKIIKENENLYVIGITGSFGKTSVKYYLHRILREKYSVCMTPESFNTAMGATLTIKNDLKNIDDIFICEMGARRLGDIKEICDIVDPNGAIVTDVGNMHLDTFKNVENVRTTKFELVDAASKSGKSKFFDKPVILLNGDNELIRDRAKDYNKDDIQIYYYGTNDNNDFYASILSVNEKGTRFKYNSRLFGSEEFETKLLGNYNIVNLVAAISYAMLLKVDISVIKNAVKGINSVAHRLQILPYGNNDILIDDAYNSNPKGARNATDVLSSFDGYVKVMVTPGMVELNDKQDIENESFAEYAGKIIDYAIVVGKTNRESLIKGFSKSMSGDKIYAFNTFDEAINYVNGNIRDKKVILLENDLSDNY